MNLQWPGHILAPTYYDVQYGLAIYLQDIHIHVHTYLLIYAPCSQTLKLA